MSQTDKQDLFSNLKYDLPASIVVFLVAVPLCLGIALASGAPLFSGIIAGIVGGIVVTSISGSPLGVSGPAAGLAVIVLNAIQSLGSFEIFLVAVVLAGILQIVMGLLKLGIIGYYFPASVIKGMLSGIGIIIILKQIPHAVGYDADPIGDFAFQQTDGHNTLTELSYMLDAISPGAVVVTLVSMFVLILWEQSFMKKIGIFRIIQGPLVVVVSGILLNIAFKSVPELAISADHLVSLPVSGSLGGFFQQFSLPDFSALAKPAVYVSAITIAVVASLETLLCVEATDKLDPQKRITPTNRELIAQGAGNMVSGLIGGLPVTQVIVRSSANIQSGGRSRTSAFLHGVLLLICAMSIPTILNMIPLASLAAILFIVGYKLAKPALFKEMWALGRQQFIPFIVTILGIVFTDLLIGIGLGLAVGVLQILYENFRTPYQFSVEGLEEKGHVIRFCLSENVTFLNKAALLSSFSRIPDGSEVIIDKRRSLFIHPDIIEIIEDFKSSAEGRGIKVTIELPDDDHDRNPVRAFGEML